MTDQDFQPPELSNFWHLSAAFTISYDRMMGLVIVMAIQLCILWFDTSSLLRATQLKQIICFVLAEWINLRLLGV